MSSRKPHPMREAISDEECDRLVAEMCHPVLSVPEGLRAVTFRSMEWQASWNRRNKSGIYRHGALYAEWCRIARRVWPQWPPQESGTSQASVAPRSARNGSSCETPPSSWPAIGAAGRGGDGLGG
jgi:hypothetical protein